MTTKGPHDWKFQQVFGDTKSEEAVDADIISAVEFDHTGNYLAIGDRGGRVVILERNKNKVSFISLWMNFFRVTYQQWLQRGAEYRVMTEFQSHEPEFDYLKSLEIEEKINKIKWLHPTGSNSHFLLTSNGNALLSSFYINSNINSQLSLYLLHR